VRSAEDFKNKIRVCTALQKMLVSCSPNGCVVRDRTVPYTHGMTQYSHYRTATTERSYEHTQKPITVQNILCIDVSSRLFAGPIRSPTTSTINREERQSSLATLCIVDCLCLPSSVSAAIDKFIDSLLFFFVG
jgi:hypothetical protein